MNESKNISIVIPCRNEEEYIAKCLNSIVNCNYNKSHLSVIVVDGKSTDKTREVVIQFTKQHNYIHLIDNEQQTTPFALNKGIKFKVADIYMILGAHAEISPDYIDQALTIFKQHPSVGCVGGIIENVSENDTAKIIADAMSTRLGVGNAHFRTGTKAGLVDTVAFGAYKKEVFEKIGYFDEALTRNQDDEFNYRVTKAGFGIYLEPKIQAKYYVRSSFHKLWNQYYQYGYWKVFVNKKHRSITTLRQLAPALLVLGIMAGPFIRLINPSFLILYVVSILLYCSLITFTSAARQKNITGTAKMILTYLTLHFAYGIGYLEGIVSFLLLNKGVSKGKEQLSR